MLIDLKHGEQIRFGADGHLGVMAAPDGSLKIVEVADVGESAILVHDKYRENPGLAFALAGLSHDDHSPTPFGIFREVESHEYSSAVSAQVAAAYERQGPGDLGALLRSNGTWMVK